MEIIAYLSYLCPRGESGARDLLQNKCFNKGTSMSATVLSTAPVYLAPDRFVMIRVYALVSGFTEKAIRRKIEDGVWVENREYIRSPDGHVMIDREGVQRWLTKGG